MKEKFVAAGIIFATVCALFTAKADDKVLTIDDLANIVVKKFIARNQPEPEILKNYVKYPDSELDKIEKSIGELKKSVEEIPKSEWETTSAYNTRCTHVRNEVQKKIQVLTDEKNRLIVNYENEEKNREEVEKKYNAEISWDEITGDYKIKDLVIAYRISSMQYDADAGDFHIELYPIRENLRFDVSEGFSICCDLPNEYVVKHIPDVEEAKQFKRDSNSKIVLITYSDLPVNLSYEHRCIRDAVYEESTDWGGDLCEMAVLLVAYTLSPETAIREAQRIKPARKQREQVSPAIYHTFLTFNINTQNVKNFTSCQIVTEEENLKNNSEQKQDTSLQRLISLIKTGHIYLSTGKLIF